MRRASSSIIALAAVLLAGCSLDQVADPSNGYPVVSVENTNFASALNVNLAASNKTASGLYYRDLTVGTGNTADAGDSIAVYYHGYFPSGTQFDATQAPNNPYTFTLGVGHVIPGWDEGVKGMKVGGSRQLIIPAVLAYGQSGAYGAGGVLVIPPNANLVFTVDLVAAP